MARRPCSAHPTPRRELAELRARLAEAEETLRAIRLGEVDAVVIAGEEGPRVFTLQGAELAYRVLIESMNEGALTLTVSGVILYANQCFARMVRQPLEQVTGSSFHRFLSSTDRAKLRPLLKRVPSSGTKIQTLLCAPEGPPVPVHISIRPLANDGSSRVILGLVVTDMTEAQRTEQQLRALTHRVVQVQEVERRRVALELHDNITQLLCAALVRFETLAHKLPSPDGPGQGEAIQLREMLGETVEEVQRISRNLRPSVLDELGLVAVLRHTSTEFAQRMGVSLKLTCAPLTTPLAADAELALYRILQEALRNVEQHARAQHISVCLRQKDAWLQLVIQDDGIGFDPASYGATQNGKAGLGLLSMRERAASVDGTLEVLSAPGQGTRLQAQVPLKY